MDYCPDPAGIRISGICQSPAQSGIDGDGISLLVVGIAIFFAVKSITGPIKQIMAGFKDIAQSEGDLTSRYIINRLTIRGKEE